jgi:hypothetical protein
MKSALRRHHRQRIMQKRWRRCDWLKAIKPENVGKYIDTPHPCSEMCCGNQRRWQGPTRQERKAARAEDYL